MNMAQQAQGASRYTGIGVVIAVHVVMIAALSSGLVQQVIDKKPHKTEARLIEQEPPPPPPLPPRQRVEDPTQKLVIQQIEPPPIPVVSEVSPTDVPADTPTLNPLRTGTSSGAGPSVVAQPEKATVPTVVTPGMVCTRMGKPELPAVNWAGDALFRVQATVRAGRVAATEFTVLSGVMDPKTRRALQSAIANTLRDTYECPGEHRFEQEFNVRID